LRKKEEVEKMGQKNKKRKRGRNIAPYL